MHFYICKLFFNIVAIHFDAGGGVEDQFPGASSKKTASFIRFSTSPFTSLFVENLFPFMWVSRWFKTVHPKRVQNLLLGVGRVTFGFVVQQAVFNIFKVSNIQSSKLSLHDWSFTNINTFSWIGALTLPSIQISSRVFSFKTRYRVKLNQHFLQ